MLRCVRAGGAFTPRLRRAGGATGVGDGTVRSRRRGLRTRGKQRRSPEGIEAHRSPPDLIRLFDHSELPAKEDSLIDDIADDVFDGFTRTVPGDSIDPEENRLLIPVGGGGVLECGRHFASV